MTRSHPMHWIQDGVLAVFLAAVAIAELWVPFESRQGDGSLGLGTFVAVALCLGLVFRRRFPLATIVAMVVLWVTVHTITPIPVLFWGQFVPFLVAVYSVARHERGWRLPAGAVTAAALLLFFDFRIDVLQAPEEMAFHWTVTVVVGIVGRSLAVFESKARDSARRAAAIESEGRLQTLEAIADERARIARELHDVVAHSVSVMVVQAGAAEQAVDDQDIVREALRTIRSTGATALGEMRRVVAMLREPGEQGELEPQPGAGALQALIDETRAAGLRAELLIEGSLRQLPVGLDLTVYRIVQEALTNVRKHATASSTRVTLRFLPDEIEVEIRDDGSGAGDASGVGPDRIGHGLIGMRERTTLYGGRLEASSAPDGGFRVLAVLPAGAVI